MDMTVRDYRGGDESAWLRCRVLAFLPTPYYDDVLQAKPDSPAPGWAIVATDPRDGEILGVLDASVSADGALATIDTIAVHPDHQRRGVGDALLRESLRRAAAAGVDTLDAWTRDHPPALAWYRARFPLESEHYLHVHAENRAQALTAVDGRDELRPIAAFLHATVDREAELRARFPRTHVCRRFSRPVAPRPAG